MKTFYLLLIFSLLLTITGCNNENIENKKVEEVEKIEMIQTLKKTNQENIYEIDKICSTINELSNNYGLKSYNDIDVYKESNPEQYSSETNEISNLAIINLQKLYDENQLKKIIVKFEGDKEDQISEYYFDNENIILVDKTKIFYNKHKWDEEFNSQEKDLENEKYYFYNNEIIKTNYIDNSNTISIKEVQENILNDIGIYKRYDKRISPNFKK